MRHGRLIKLSRKTKPRLRLLRNLVTHLVEKDMIVTTHAKARAMRGLADRVISIAKREHLTETRKRQLLRGILYTDTAVEKVMNDLLPRMETQNGQYANRAFERLRKGDGSKMVRIWYSGGIGETEVEFKRETTKQKCAFTMKILTEEASFFEDAFNKLKENQETNEQENAAKELEGKEKLEIKDLLIKSKFLQKEIERVKREIGYLNASGVLNERSSS